MFNSVSPQAFQGVSYLQDSDLVKNNNGIIHFSLDRPNVIVGPNGSGKSALLTALSIHTMSFFTGQSELDPHMTRSTHDDECWWSLKHQYGQDWEFLKGLNALGDGAPAVYYRPGHIPGNGDSVAYSMMCGYFDSAREYGRMIDEKSSGQQCSALLKRFTDILNGTRTIPTDYAMHKDWEFNAMERIKSRNDSNDSFGRNIMPWEYKGAVLEAIAKQAKENPGTPAVILDEPEQSLDAKSEFKLWKSIKDADCSKMQLIVATHSIYPFMHLDAFNVIETVPGYIRDMKEIL